MFNALTVMWLPAVPSVEEAIVTVLPLALAVLMPRFAAHVPVLIAAARLVARVDGVLLVIKVPVKLGAEPVHVVEPLELPLTVPQEKPLKVLARERKAPGFESVTVTVLLLALAVTPTAPKEELQALIALARLVAKPDVLKGLGITNVPLVELGQVWVPSVPPLSAVAEGDHAKPAAKLVEIK